MHVHTSQSKDALLSPQQIVSGCQQKGLGALAITDHNTIAGALTLRSKAPFPVIIGQEISTSQGEVMGLFLEEEVPAGLSPLEAVTLIKEQGGLAGVPHPFDRLRASAVGETVLKGIIGELDFIEGFNSRVTLPADNRRAQEYARAMGLRCTAGSDAHSAYELGMSYVHMPSFNGKEEFLKSLGQGRIVGNRSPFWVHFFSVYARLRRRLVRG